MLCGEDLAPGCVSLALVRSELSSVKLCRRVGQAGVPRLNLRDHHVAASSAFGSAALTCPWSPSSPPILVPTERGEPHGSFSGLQRRREDADGGCVIRLADGDGRFTAVLDLDSGSSLGFEVACHEARRMAITSVRLEGQLDKSWVLGECNRLCEIVEEASAILSGVSTVERGATEIRDRYSRLRRDALQVIDGMRARAEE